MKINMKEQAKLLSQYGFGPKDAAAVARFHSEMPPQKRGTIKVQKSDDEESAVIMLYDVIGFDWWTGEGTTAKDFAETLAALEGVPKIDVRINSDGGDVFDGWAIYNMLASVSADVMVYVDGMAASIASVIAMAGDTIRMPANAMMMIHRAWGVTMGNAIDMRSMADVLEKIDGLIAQTYATRTGSDPADHLAQMDEETYFTAVEAVEAGLADEIVDKVQTKTAAKDENPKPKARAEKLEERRADPADEQTGSPSVAVRLRLLEIDEHDLDSRKAVG